MKISELIFQLAQQQHAIGDVEVKLSLSIYVPQSQRGRYIFTEWRVFRDIEYVGHSDTEVMIEVKDS